MRKEFNTVGEYLGTVCGLYVACKDGSFCFHKAWMLSTSIVSSHDVLLILAFVVKQQLVRKSAIEMTLLYCIVCICLSGSFVVLMYVALYYLAYSYMKLPFCTQCAFMLFVSINNPFYYVYFNNLIKPFFFLAFFLSVFFTVYYAVSHVYVNLFPPFYPSFIPLLSPFYPIKSLAIHFFCLLKCYVHV